MSKKPVAPKETPPKQKPERDLDDALGECMRDLAVSEGAIKGRWDALSEPAKDFWRKRSASLRERAAKRGITIGATP
jgi:hypothetical protein